MDLSATRRLEEDDRVTDQLDVTSHHRSGSESSEFNLKVALKLSLRLLIDPQQFQQQVVSWRESLSRVEQQVSRGENF